MLAHRDRDEPNADKRDATLPHPDDHSGPDLDALHGEKRLREERCEGPNRQGNERGGCEECDACHAPTLRPARAQLHSLPREVRALPRHATSAW